MSRFNIFYNETHWRSVTKIIGGFLPKNQYVFLKKKNFGGFILKIFGVGLLKSPDPTPLMRHNIATIKALLLLL